MDSALAIRHGNRFPYDADDAWWSSHEKPPEPFDWAHAAARGVIADLTDRRGIKDGFKRVDEATRIKIVLALAEIIRQSKNMDGTDYMGQ